MIVLETEDLHRIYPVSPPIHALTGVNFQLSRGERTVILGKSGSGKSTFLNQIGLLDKPTKGLIRLLGQETANLKPRALNAMRADTLGFIFQENHILGHRTVEENLVVKLAISNRHRSVWAETIDTALARVDLTHRKGAFARLLSGGEKQRLAVARAIITEPQVLLADEPTGNLDDENAQRMLELFDEQARHGTAVVIITHDQRLVNRVDTAYQLQTGRLSQIPSPSAHTVNDAFQ